MHNVLNFVSDYEANPPLEFSHVVSGKKFSSCIRVNIVHWSGFDETGYRKCEAVQELVVYEAACTAETDWQHCCAVWLVHLCI